jgi:hypothetical protein
MYTPESHAQMFDILAALRAYAGINGMPQLAEMLDDALLLLAEEGREKLGQSANGRVRGEG